MGSGSQRSAEIARYAAFAQIGFEMAAPIALGVWLDIRHGWLPWGTAIGTVVGFVGGLLHVFALLRRFERDEKASRSRDVK